MTCDASQGSREGGSGGGLFVLFVWMGGEGWDGAWDGARRGNGVYLFVCLLVIGVCVGGGMRCGVVCDGAMQGT